MSKLQTEGMQCNMQLEHNRTELKNKQKELKQGESDYVRDEKQLVSMEKELDSLQVLNQRCEIWKSQNKYVFQIARGLQELVFKIETRTSVS